MARLEHVNITVKDPKATAEMLQALFGWHTRWDGAAKNNGYTIHVGEAETYLALYAGPEGAEGQRDADDSYRTRAGLNHIGVVVDDLDAAERAVKARGYEPHSHAEYEPGRRFYFHEENSLEIEVVCYA